MSWINASNLPTWMSAVGSIFVTILAIWGDKFRAWLAGPILILESRNFKGDITQFTDGKKAIFYHLTVKNKRPWSPAKNVRVLIAGILKKKADGSYHREDIFVPQQLTWSPMEFHQIFPVVCREDVVDLGCLIQNEQFKLRPYVTPNNFKGCVDRGQSMRVELIVAADNFVSKKPAMYEISWDGIWTEDLYELEKHLVIKEIL